jgi:hypothetical protein
MVFLMASSRGFDDRRSAELPAPGESPLNSGTSESSRVHESRFGCAVVGAIRYDPTGRTERGGQVEQQTALEILTALLAGTDPRTGTALPPGDPCRADLVRDAIGEAIELLGRSVRDHPPQAGTPWTPEEERRLAEEFREGASLAMIATAHARTKGAVRSRLVRLGLIDRG